jgi:Ca2+-binding RTX toxin-like protein
MTKSSLDNHHPAIRQPRILVAVLAAVLGLSGVAVLPGAASAQTSSLVINEIMQNPDAVFDNNGEWFELYNPSGTDIDIDGWTISDNGADSHTINNGGPLTVPAGGYLVLGNNTDTTTNGNTPVAYSYGSSFFLSNSDDELVLTDDEANEIDRVEWDGGPNFPDPTGASMTLADPTTDNNIGANWCTATTSYGDGDLGTPGLTNTCDTPVPTCNGLAVTVFIGAGDLPTEGDDVILGTGGADVIDALGGDDTVCGLDGGDLIYGRDGNDTLYGDEGDDVLIGNAGNDTINGGDDNDRVYSGSSDDIINGDAGDDILNGGNGADTISGDAGMDRILGGGGDDIDLSGGDDNDTINAGSGNDTSVNGDGGNDIVSGNAGNDTVSGGDDNDTVRGGSGDDQVNGNAGDDFVAGNGGVDVCDGGSGTDTAGPITGTASCETLLNIP